VEVDGGPGARVAEQQALRHRAEGPALARVLAAALVTVDPTSAIERAVDASTDGLRIGTQVLALSPHAGVWCVAVGKAAPIMAAALVQRIPAARLRGGVVVAKHAPPRAGGAAQAPARVDEVETQIEPGPSVDLVGPLPVVLGAHPIPDERSEAAGRAVLEVLARVRPDDVVVVLLSGGASSLMVAPCPGVALDDLRELGRALIESGAPIEDVNAVRKALDGLKGGGLLRRAAPARVATLVLSDVVDAPLHVVGSGPTLPDPSGRAAARAVLERWSIAAPSAVQRALARDDDPAHTESSEASDSLAPLLGGPVVELASNATAVEAALAAALAEGWQAVRMPTLRGEARDQGRALAATLRSLRPTVPTLLVAGGETTVTMRGHGRGGRNQTLALAAMLELHETPDTTLIAFATDGEDGPTDAAGAVVDGGSLARARALGLDPARSLDDDDAYPVFDALGDLLRIGPTGTNVCDLALALARP
jgi:glycerate 2-kinase